MLLAFSMVLGGYPMLYLACKNNIEWFFPCLAIIVGAHYLPFFYGYQLKSFIVLGAIMLVLGITVILYKFIPYSTVPYIVCALLFMFSIINYLGVKNELRTT